MNRIQHLLDDLQDTDTVAAVLQSQAASEADRINLEAMQKRRADLERRLNNELQISAAGYLALGGRRDPK